MSDPWGSFNNFMTGFRQFINNPSQYGVQGNPDSIIQKMMSEGKLSQDQYNAARQAASQIQNNPLFSQLMGGRR